MNTPERIWLSPMSGSELCAGVAFDNPPPTDRRPQLPYVEYLRADWEMPAPSPQTDMAVWQQRGPGGIRTEVGIEFGHVEVVSARELEPDAADQLAADLIAAAAAARAFRATQDTEAP